MTNAEMIEGKRGMDLLLEIVRILRSKDGVSVGSRADHNISKALLS